MKYSFNWLKELSGTKKPPEKVVELLTMRAMEVEGVEKVGQIPEGVIVGKILEIRKHPNADKLQIAIVETQELASREVQKLQIVCGAPNIQVGQMVPLATIGTKLPNGLEIKAAEIRGEKSFGMLCAADELGLGDDYSGILILPKNAKVGAPAAKYLGGDDTIIEIKVLPDRAHDGLSHVGVAREITVLENKQFDYDFNGLKLPSKKSKILAVKIEDKKLCPRYIGAVMTDVEIKPSPVWMQERLKACGIKVINNVVDATNYVMLELGSPLHAFDLEKISTKDTGCKIQDANKSQISKYKAQIVVRRAKDDEKMRLLDGSEIVLNNSDLLITNSETPLALAGIMGGKDSGISEATQTIVIEAASFNATNIRRTRTRLNIKTESSDRFEKDLDPNLAEKALVRIMEILEHTAEAKLEGVVDAYLDKVKPWKIKLNLDYARNLLGENVPKEEVIKVLNSLGTKVVKKRALRARQTSKRTGNGLLEPGGELICEIPTFRIDIRTQEDLIEEIGRVWGYDKIKPQALVEPVEPAKINEQVFFERKIKNILAGLGYDEMYNYSFYSRRDADICGFSDVKHYELANPMNPEQELVRVSLVPNILKNVRQNLKHFEIFNLFEIGRVYYPNNNKVEEKRMLTMAVVLKNDKSAETFYHIKGALADLLDSLGVKGYVTSFFDVACPKRTHSGRCAEIKVNNTSISIGIIAEVNPAVLTNYKIKKRVAMVEIDLEKLLTAVPKSKTYQPIGKFPTVTRDISMVVPAGVTYAQIRDLVQKTGDALISDVQLFDYFEAKKSLAIRVFLSAPGRTLASGEVDEVMNKIILGLEKELKVSVRK
jgi:phenylalanyl-tRNA synthetase beta chain